MPCAARRSEHRVSAVPPLGRLTQHSSAARAGIEPACSDRKSEILTVRRTGHLRVVFHSLKCVGQELNLHSLKADGLRPSGLANAQPTQRCINGPR